MANRPFSGFGVYAVEGHRIVLPSGIESILPWFRSGESISCIATPSAPSGMAIFSQLHLREHQALAQRLGSESLGPEDVGSALHEVSRQVSIRWEVTIDPQRRLRLPAGARDLGLVPSQPRDRAAVLAFSGIIEIWKPAELLDHVRTSAARWGALRAASGIVTE